MSILDIDSILCCKGILPDNLFNGFSRIEISSHSFIGGNVISLGNKEIIANSTNVEAIEILRKKGFTVHPIDLSEFLKGTGGPTCLILPA